MTIDELRKMPCLVLEWKKTNKEFNWIVEYYLNLPLKHEFDGRAGKKKQYLKIKIGGTRVEVGSNNPYPISKHDGKLNIPFRDGAHIKWDSDMLRLPMYGVYENHVERFHHIRIGND